MTGINWFVFVDGLVLLAAEWCGLSSTQHSTAQQNPFLMASPGSLWQPYTYLAFTFVCDLGKGFIFFFLVEVICCDTVLSDAKPALLSLSAHGSAQPLLWSL